MNQNGPSAESATTRRAVLGSVGAGAAGLLAGCTVAVESERETAQVEYSVPGSEVERVAVDGGDGRTTVRGWEGPAVRVEATKYARGATDIDDVRVTQTVNGGTLDIRAERPDGFVLGPSGGGLESLDVRVPAGTRVTRVDIDDGSGTVSEVTGDIAMHLDDGSLDVGPVDGRLSVSIDDGEMTVGEVDGLVGDLDDGAIEMTDPATVGDFSADDGSLDLAIDGLDGDITVQGDDGDITAELASTVDATVVLRTDDGDVGVEGGLLEDLTTAGGTTRGTVGNGGDRLTIETDDGSIQLRPL